MLIKCPECQHDVSDCAIACPNCGYPLTCKMPGLTFAELYQAYFHSKYEEPHKRQLSVSSRNSTISAFKNCSTLHNRIFRTLRKADLQAVVDACPLKHASLELIVSLYKGLYQYALENEIVNKDFSQFVTISSPDDDESGEPFTDDELQLLWNHSSRPDVQMVLIMIYTGFRISAFQSIELHLDERYLKGGVKTKAGKNRIVPIHNAIYDFVTAFHTNYPAFSSSHFRVYDFYPLMSELGMAYTSSGKKHTPHDTRHTFSWLCDRYHMDELSKHMLMGHSLGNDIERSVYGHRTIEELRAAIDLIQVPYT